MTKKDEKQYWFESVKFHDPDFPMKWCRTVASLRVLIAMISFWVFLLLCPWTQVAQIPGFSLLISLMSQIFPSITGLPTALSYSGELHSKAQLAVIYFAAVLYLLYVGLNTGNFPIVKEDIPRWAFPGMFLSFGSLFVFCIAVFKNWDGSVDFSSINYYESEWKLTGFLILFWYGTAVSLAISVAAFRTLVGLCYRFIGNKLR